MLNVKDKLSDFILSFAFALRFYCSLLSHLLFFTLRASIKVNAKYKA